MKKEEAVYLSSFQILDKNIEKEDKKYIIKLQVKGPWGRGTFSLKNKQNYMTELEECA